MGANKTCARFRVKTPEGAIQTLVFFGDLERLGSFLNENMVSEVKKPFMPEEGIFLVCSISGRSEYL